MDDVFPDLQTEETQDFNPKTSDQAREAYSPAFRKAVNEIGKN